MNWSIINRETAYNNKLIAGSPTPPTLDANEELFIAQYLMPDLLHPSGIVFFCIFLKKDNIRCWHDVCGSMRTYADVC